MRAIFTSILLLTLTGFTGSGYHVIDKIPLGGEGGWDYLTLDSASHRLYISHSTHVMVLDTVTERIVGDIPDTPGVHGLALAPELNRGFISNGKANTATIFDMKTLKVIGQVNTGENPDAILYDPATRRVFTFNGRSKDVTIFDAVSSKVLSTTALGGKPEFAVTDNQGRVFVNIEDTNEAVELNSRTLTVSKRYPLRPCNEPTGMAIDIERHRVFSGCHNKLMTVLDVETGQLVATVPIGEGVDGTAFDPGTGLIFSSNGDGTLTVVRESSPGKFEPETIPTQRGARTIVLDTKTHKIYLPTARFAPTLESPAESPRQSPAMIKDSFMVLVVGK